MDNFEKILPAVNNPNINKNPSNIDSPKTVPLDIEKFDKTEVSGLIDDLVSLSEDPEAYKIRKELIRILNLGRPTEPLLAPVDTIVEDPYTDYLQDIGRYDLLSGTPVNTNDSELYVEDSLGQQQEDYLDDSYYNDYGVERSSIYNLTSLTKILNDVRENFFTNNTDSEMVLNNLYELENYIDRVQDFEEKKYCEWAISTLEEFFISEVNTPKENFDKNKEKMYQIFIKLQEILRKSFGF